MNAVPDDSEQFRAAVLQAVLEVSEQNPQPREGGQCQGERGA